MQRVGTVEICYMVTALKQIPERLQRGKMHIGVLNILICLSIYIYIITYEETKYATE